jgi:hypothetical protein
MVATPPRRKQELADDPFRAVKRACLECGGPIANWGGAAGRIADAENIVQQFAQPACVCSVP